MIDKWIARMVIGFVLRQIAKFKETIDWVKVRADLEVRVRDLLPGDWFDDEVCSLMNIIMDKIVAVLGASDCLEVLLELVAAQDWAGALQKLKELLLPMLPVGSKSHLAVSLA